MLDHFYNYYILQIYGPGFVATNIIYAVAVVVVLNPVLKTRRDVARILLESALLWLVAEVYSSIYYVVLGSDWLDRTMMLMILVVYAVFCSRLKKSSRILRSSVLFASSMLMLPISEPIGEAIENYINADYTWAEHLTSVVVLVMTLLVALFISRLSTDGFTYVPLPGIAMVVAISVIGTGLTLISNQVYDAERSFSIALAAGLWVVILATYYLFYMMCREYERNLELIALGHKEEVEQELLQVTQENMEAFHQFRHDIQNHNAYISALADRGDLEGVRNYLANLSEETAPFFRFIECGNDVINGVMNHSIRVARDRGIRMDAQIIVPPRLPFRAVKLCSLLSNLMDNAIEGAARSGAENPVIDVQIWPNQDYLFIKVTNPVCGEMADRRSLSLKSTKQDKALHGYGTKIIRNVAELYQGSASFEVQEGKFVASAMLFLGGK